MKKTLTDVLIMLDEALNAGCNFHIYKEDGKTIIDLNTHAKSGCNLIIEDGKIMAHRRYKRIDEVFNFDDILNLVFDCAHGRSYFNLDWVKVLETNGFGDPKGNL